MGYIETASQFGSVGSGTAGGSARASSGGSGISAGSMVKGFGSILEMGSAIYGGYLQNKTAKANASLIQSQGAYSSVIAEFNAAVSRANAEAIRATTDLDIERMKKQARSLRGRQVARYASSGVKTEGSPLLVMIDSAQDAKLDIAITDYNAKTQMRQAESQAKGYEREGQLAKTEAKAQAEMIKAEGKFKKKQSITKSITSLLSIF